MEDPPAIPDFELADDESTVPLTSSGSLEMVWRRFVPQLPTVERLVDYNRGCRSNRICGEMEV